MYYRLILYVISFNQDHSDFVIFNDKCSLYFPFLSQTIIIVMIEIHYYSIYKNKQKISFILTFLKLYLDRAVLHKLLKTYQLCRIFSINDLCIISSIQAVQ